MECNTRIKYFLRFQIALVTLKKKMQNKLIFQTIDRANDYINTQEFSL